MRGRWRDMKIRSPLPATDLTWLVPLFELSPSLRDWALIGQQVTIPVSHWLIYQLKVIPPFLTLSLWLMTELDRRHQKPSFSKCESGHKSYKIEFFSKIGTIWHLKWTCKTCNRIYQHASGRVIWPHHDGPWYPYFPDLSHSGCCPLIHQEVVDTPAPSPDVSLAWISQVNMCMKQGSRFKRFYCCKQCWVLN